MSVFMSAKESISCSCSKVGQVGSAPPTSAGLLAVLTGPVVRTRDSGNRHSYYPTPCKCHFVHMPLVLLNLFILRLLPASMWFRLAVIWHWLGCGKVEVGIGMTLATLRGSLFHIFPSWWEGQSSLMLSSTREGGCLQQALSEWSVVPGYRCDYH